MKYYLAILFGSFLGSLQAQKPADTLSFQQLEKYTPGLKPVIHKYVQYYTDSLGNLLRMNSLKTRVIQVNPAHPDQLCVIQRYSSDRGTDSDTAFINRKDFSPLAYHTHIQSGGYKEVVAFQQGEVRTAIYYKDSTKTDTYPIGADYFAATTIEDIMSVLPLKEGYTAIIKTVNPGVRHAANACKVQVLRKEKIQLADQSVKEAYLVEAGYPAFNSYSYYWFSSDKLLLKHSFKMRNGTVFVVERLMP